MEKPNKCQGLIKIAEKVIFANHRAHIHLLEGPSLPGSLLLANVEEWAYSSAALFI
jgi:hypothetical protein